MGTKRIKFSGKQAFLLLLSMATFTVVAAAVKLEVDENKSLGQNQHQNENQSRPAYSKNVGFSVNKTREKLALALDFNSDDLTFEREKTKHDLRIREADWTYHHSIRYLECLGENIKSLSVIACGTMESCEEKTSLLFDQSKCRLNGNMDMDCGRECSREGTSHSIYRSGFSHSIYKDTDKSELSCLGVEVFLYYNSTGIVQCTSEENGVPVTTFDHYTIGYSEAAFLSTFENKKKNDLIKMELYVSSLTKDLNDKSNLSQSDENSQANANVNVTLFVDEEVTSLKCKVPKLLFPSEKIIVSVYKKDGSTVDLDSKMISAYFDGFLKAELTGFRVPPDVVAFSCSAQKTNSSERLENRINVTVQDLPSKVIVKSGKSTKMTVDLTSGAKVSLNCQLTGPSQIKKNIRSQMRKLRYDFQSESSSTPVITFLRFFQVAGEHLSCQTWDSDEASKNSATVRHRNFGYGQQNTSPLPFIFKLAPSAPKIHNPNPNNPTSSVYLIYHEDHIVDQTLLCLFNGDPKPVIIWMKNGQKFLSPKSMGIRRQGNETMKQVKIRLDSKTIQPNDFEQDSGSAHVNFSCVTSNYFGSDRLDFIITLTGGCKNHFQNPNTTIKTIREKSTSSSSSTIAAESSKILPSSTTTTSTSTFETREAQNSNSSSSSNSTLNLEKRGAAEKSKLALIVTGFFVLSFICILGFSILWKKRAAFAPTVESPRILTFRNLAENDESESARNVLAD